MICVVYLSGDHSLWAALAGMIVLYANPKFSWRFYAFFSIFWPVMEMIILNYSGDKAWVYKDQDIFKVPYYIFPLWSIVSECVIDIFIWGQRIDIW